MKFKHNLIVLLSAFILCATLSGCVAYRIAKGTAQITLGTILAII